MIICALVLVFFAVVATGPDNMERFRAHRRARQERLDAPDAKLLAGPWVCPVCYRKTCAFRKYD